MPGDKVSVLALNQRLEPKLLPSCKNSSRMPNLPSTPELPSRESNASSPLWETHFWGRGLFFFQAGIHCDAGLLGLLSSMCSLTHLISPAVTSSQSHPSLHQWQSNVPYSLQTTRREWRSALPLHGTIRLCALLSASFTPRSPSLSPPRLQGSQMLYRHGWLLNLNSESILAHPT